MRNLEEEKFAHMLAGSLMLGRESILKYVRVPAPAHNNAGAADASSGASRNSLGCSSDGMGSSASASSSPKLDVRGNRKRTNTPHTITIPTLTQLGRANSYPSTDAGSDDSRFGTCCTYIVWV